MIVEHRVYTMRVGTTQEYLRLYETEGMDIQRPILGNLLGYFSTEIGPLNRIVHLWGYDSLEDRARRRAELQGDERWRAYLPKIQPLILDQETMILQPAPFSPIR